MTKTNPSDWLFFTDSDLTTAKSSFEDKLYHIVCFHAQQAAEKAMKAYLTSKDQIIPKDHSLRGKLYAAIHDSLPEIDQYLEILNFLDRFYLPTRYPDALPGSLPDGLPTKKDAQAALVDTEKFVAFIRSQL